MRSENQPPQPFGVSGHHPSHSQEGPARVRGGTTRPGRNTEELDIFADPPTESRPRPRPRRNSDSSIASKTIGPEEERRRRERHRREREARHRGDGKHRPSGSKSKKPSQRLDIIDSLDVSSIYGKGRKSSDPQSKASLTPQQCSIMTAHSMPATLTATVKAPAAPPWKPLPKTARTTH